MKFEQIIAELSAKAVARVNELKEQGGEVITDEQVRRIVEELVEKSDDLKRQTEYQLPAEMAEKLFQSNMVVLDDGVMTDSKMIMPAADLKNYYSDPVVDKLEEWKSINDNLLILGTLLTAKEAKQGRIQSFNDVLRSTKLYAGSMNRLKSDSLLRKALSTGASTAGAEWIPTAFSSQLWERIRLELKVSNLFNTINMPTNPYKLPIVSAGATGYLIPESTTEEGIKFKASSPSTGNFQFTAKKFGGRIVWSDEMNEDSIVAMLNFTRDSLAVALGEAQEKAIINGDDSATHQDSNVTSVWDAQKAFKGLRYYLLNNADSPAVSAAAGNITTSLLRKARIKMGKHGVDPKKLALIASVTGYIQMLAVSEVLTIDKYGPKATVMEGEIGRIDGQPIVVSEFLGDNLNASGVYDGTTTNLTSLLQVYRPGFWIGNRAGITIGTERDIQTDQIILVAKQRTDFVSPYGAAGTGVVHVGGLYNVKTTIA